MEPSRPDPQILKLTVLLQLQRRARQCSAEELPFVMVNETCQLIAYRQAVLWRVSTGRKASVTAVSGVAVPNNNAPMIMWLNDVCNHLSRSDYFSAIRQFNKKDLPASLAASWDEWLPGCGLLAPLTDPEGSVYGVLGLFRQEQWTDAEPTVLSYLTESYAQSLILAMTRKKRRAMLTRMRGKILTMGVLGLAAVACFLPVRLSALSPAVIVSSAPEMIRSPLNGVVKGFSVAPNHSVRRGEKLLSLEDRELRSRLDVARKAYEIASEEYLQVSQQAIVEDNAKSRIAILEARMEQQRMEVEYVDSLLQRVVLESPIDGVAIFDDPNDWIGRPVSVGETILQVSHPHDISLEIHVPAGDAINLERGADVLFFLNTSPVKPVPAKISFASYHAGLQSDGYLAYRVEADFSVKDPRLRIGLRGTAKIYGESRPLGLLLLRKPINVVRQWLGL